jgi:hypothetical protein
MNFKTIKTQREKERERQWKRQIHGEWREQAWKRGTLFNNLQ